MKLALCLFAPPHATSVFEPIVQLYFAHLQDMGYDVTIAHNQLLKNHLNLWVGYQYLPLSAQAMIAHHFDYVLIQLEQLGVKSGWFAQQDHHFEDFLPLLTAAQAIWDYTPENIAFLNLLGLSAALMPLGYHPKLQHFTPDHQPSIDVLFYGSLFQRRSAVIEALKPHCKVVCLHGVYQQELESALKKSKVVLNIHSYDDLPLLEQARLFQLLSNKVFVISEDSTWNPYGTALITSPYANLKETVLHWLAQPQSSREHQAQLSHNALKAIDFKGNLKQGLASVLKSLSDSR